MDEFQHPDIIRDDGTVLIWDPSSHSFVERTPETKPKEDMGHAHGSDAFLFDPATQLEKSQNPMFEGFLAAYDPDDDSDLYERGEPDDDFTWQSPPTLLNNPEAFVGRLMRLWHDDVGRVIVAVQQRLIRERGTDPATAGDEAREIVQSVLNGEFPSTPSLLPQIEPEGLTVPDTLPWGEDEQDYYRRASVETSCPECGMLRKGSPRCLKCGFVYEDAKQPTTLPTQTDPFFDVVPKEDLSHFDTIGPGTFGKHLRRSEALPVPLDRLPANISPDPENDTDLDLEKVWIPGVVGGKQETHRFVLDPYHNMYIGPASMDHAEIARQHGIDEMARGSVYDDNTAEINLQQIPGELDHKSIEAQLAKHTGNPTQLTYVPGMEDGTDAQLGGTFDVVGALVTPEQGGGFAWLKGQGIPSQELAQSVPLVFVAEHATTSDYPAYSMCKGGFVTGTGGATSHAAIVALSKGLPCVVGVGPAYAKIAQGASIRIEPNLKDNQGIVHVGPINSTVLDYMTRTQEDWRDSDLRKRQIKQKYPEWAITRGGHVDFPEIEDLEWLAIHRASVGKYSTASLDECPDCDAHYPMIERNGEKHCPVCGHQQKIIYAEANKKEAFDLGGDLENIGEDALNTGEGLVKNPAVDAGLLGAGMAGALMIPGVGEAADAALAPEEAALAGDAASALPPAAEQGMPATTDSAQFNPSNAFTPGMSENPAGASSPGRVRALMNGAMQQGANGALMNMGWQGGNSALNMGENTLGLNNPTYQDYSGYQGQLASYRQKVAQMDQTLWSFYDPRLAASDDPNTSSDLSTNVDGDDKTDEQTQGAMEDHGDSIVDPILRDLADVGNGGWNPAQHDALQTFNTHLPRIIELNLSDESGKDDPIIQHVMEVLKNAFPDMADSDQDSIGENLPDHEDDDHNHGSHDEGDGGGNDLIDEILKAAKKAKDDDEEDEDGFPVGLVDDLVAADKIKGGNDDEDNVDTGDAETANQGKLASPLAINDQPQTQVDQGSREKTEVEPQEGHKTKFNEESSAVGVGTIMNPDGQMVEAHVVLSDGPAGVATSQPPATPHHEVAPWATIDGRPLQEGKRYLLKTDGYAIPDDVTIDHIGPHELRYTYHGEGGISYPDTLTKQDFERQNMQFELKKDAPENQVEITNEFNEAPHGSQELAETAEPAQTDDLSDIPNKKFSDSDGDMWGMIPQEGESLTMENWGPEYTHDEMLAMAANESPELAWLMDTPEPVASKRQEQMMQITAGRHFTPAEQRELIHEPGKARNLSRLSLEGTHYEQPAANIDEECLFGW